MSGLNSILDTGRSSILAHQTAIATTSRNTANVNTPGYHRRDVVLTSTANPRGLDATDVRRSTDAYLGRKLYDAHSDMGSAEAQVPALGAIEQLFADRDGGLGESLDAFFNAIRSLEASPMNLDLRRDVVSTGDTLAQRVASTAESLELERRQADRLVDGMVARVNELSAGIANINRQIANSPQNGEELLDQREELANELATYVDIRTFVRDQGQMVVLLAGSMNLVDKDFSATLSATPDAGYGNMRRIDFTGKGGNAVDITGQLMTGQLGGVIELRDQVVTTMIDRLDQFAHTFIEQFNGVHELGFGTDGVGGRAFFDAPVGGVPGAAAGMNVRASMLSNPGWVAAAATAAESIGGNGNVAVIMDLETLPLAGGGVRSFVEEMADMVGTVGRIVQSNDRSLQSATVELEQLESLKASQVGVSIDEEMIDLTRFQRGYQAGARIIATVNELFQSLLSM